MSASHVKKKILIVSSPENGLAEMFCGYLLHFGNQDIDIAVLPVPRMVPQHVQEILREDGIHQTYPGISAPSKHFDVGVVFNDAQLPNQTRSMPVHQLTVDAPQNDSKDAWRPIREEVKKMAISILGELLRAQK